MAYRNRQEVGGYLAADANFVDRGGKTKIELRLGATYKDRTEWFDVDFWPSSKEHENFLRANLLKGTYVEADGETRFSFSEKQGFNVMHHKLLAKTLNPFGIITLNKVVHDASAKPSPAPAPAAPAALEKNTAPKTTVIAVFDPTLPPGHVRLQIIAAGGSGEIVVPLDVATQYQAQGVGKITAIGTPCEKILPTSLVNAGLSDSASRPELPSEAEVDSYAQSETNHF